MPLLVVETPHSLRRFVGREIATTEWFSVTQDRIQQFAEAREDRQWIHIDRERAEQNSPYGAPIAHGFLTLPPLSQFLRQAIQNGSGVRMSVNYSRNRVRFPSPVPADSRIRARFTLQAVNDIADGVEATFSAGLKNCVPITASWRAVAEANFVGTAAALTTSDRRRMLERSISLAVRRH